MWIIFGSVAIITMFINLYFFKKGKNNQIFMSLSLSFTALTLAAFYSGIANAVEMEDWAGIMDVVPTMSTALWILTISSILLNALPLFLNWRKNN